MKRLACAIVLASCARSKPPATVTIEPKAAASQTPVHVELEPDGAELVKRNACITCHDVEQRGVGPRFGGLFGSQVPLAGGRAVVADEDYIVRSIFEPQADVVDGYARVMPSFRGSLDEKQARAIARYIRTLR